MSGSDADIIAHGRRLAALELKVTKLYEHLQLAEPEADSSEFSPEVQQLLLEGREIEAIKLYREQAGVSLGEAKDAIFRGGNPG